jgi:hypothetical protein
VIAAGSIVGFSSGSFILPWPLGGRLWPVWV